MRALYCLIALLALLLLPPWHAIAQYACDSGVPAIPPLIRLGLHTWNTGFCNAGLDLNADHTYLDAHACTDDHMCLVNDWANLTIENLTASDDDYIFFMPGRNATLTAIACHCDANCGTTATLAFERNDTGNRIDLTGGGDFSCFTTGSSVPTAVTFDTADSDRIVPALTPIRFDVTNTPTTSQKITLTLYYTYTP
jgi:hypothetical protein